MTPTPQPASEVERTAGEAERRKFEEAAFLQYYISGIRRTNEPVANALQIHFVPGAGKNKEQFVMRYPSDGAYVEPTLNAAWWAWQARAKAAVNSHAALVEALADTTRELGSLITSGDDCSNAFVAWKKGRAALLAKGE